VRNDRIIEIKSRSFAARTGGADDGLDAIVRALWLTNLRPPPSLRAKGRANARRRQAYAKHPSLQCVALWLLRFAWLPHDVERVDFTPSPPRTIPDEQRGRLGRLPQRVHSTYSLKPCIAAPVAPKQRLGML